MDKQSVNEAIVEKLHSKMDFQLLEQYFVFLRKSVKVIMRKDGVPDFIIKTLFCHAVV